MADTRALITVFSVGGIEAELEDERLVFAATAEELDSVVAGDFRLVAGAAVRHFLVVGIAIDGLIVVEGLRVRLAADADSEFAGKPSPITCDFQGGGVTLCPVIVGNWRCAEGVSVGAFVEPGEVCRAAGGADGRGNERVGESDSFRGEFVHRGCLQGRVTSAPHAIPSMVVAEEEDDVGTLVSSCWGEGDDQRG